jgi:hypothetical protein
LADLPNGRSPQRKGAVNGKANGIHWIGFLQQHFAFFVLGVMELLMGDDNGRRWGSIVQYFG